MITHLPPGQLNPALTQAILHAFNRQRQFRALLFSYKQGKLHKESQEVLQGIWNRLLGVYPEIFSKALPVTTRRNLSFAERVARMPECFKVKRRKTS